MTKLKLKKGSRQIPTHPSTGGGSPLSPTLLFRVRNRLQGNYYPIIIRWSSYCHKMIIILSYDDHYNVSTFLIQFQSILRNIAIDDNMWVWLVYWVLKNSCVSNWGIPVSNTVHFQPIFACPASFMPNKQTL